MEEKKPFSEEQTSEKLTEENTAEVFAEEPQNNGEGSLPSDLLEEQNKKESLFDKAWNYIFPKKKVGAPEVFLPPEEEYVKRLEKFNNFYLQFVAMIFALVALSLLVMIHTPHLWIGFGALFLVVLLYVNFTSDELFKHMGVTYKSIVGGIKIVVARAKYGEIFLLPARLMWLDVTTVGDRAFKSPKNTALKEVWLPETLESVGEDIFEDCPALEKICFEGTEEKWASIQTKTDFSPYEIEYNVKYPTIPKKVKPTKPMKTDKKKKK